MNKPWLFEPLPELNGKSSKDICLNVDGILCVVLVNDGAPTPQNVDLMKDIIKAFEKKMDRGLTFKYMWLDSTKEIEWKNLFGLSSTP